MTPRDPLFREDWEPTATDVERIVARIEASPMTAELKRYAVAAMRRSVRPREPGDDDDDDGEEPEDEDGGLVPLGQFLKDGSGANGTRRKRFSRLLDDGA